jgi:hypothetical protein
MKQLTITVFGSVMFLFLSCGTMDLAKKYPNMIANVDPFSIGVAKVQFDRPFSSKVDTAEIEAIFHPRLNEVSLEFKYNLYSYRQFWDESARKQFAASLDLYKKDFEDRKLINDSKKTRSVYGIVKGRVEWIAFRYTRTRVANPTIEIGYRYKESTPFFTTLMRSAKEIVDDSDEGSSALNSLEIKMYFTRAQAEEIVKLFDQTRLLELLQEVTGVVKNEPADTDEAEDSAPEAPYREYGEP